MNQSNMFAIEAALSLSEALQADESVSLGKNEIIALLNSYVNARMQLWRSQAFASVLLAERNAATAPQEVANRPKETLDDAYQAPFSADDGA